MRTLFILALLAAAPVAAQVRPMPSYDDGTSDKTYPYVETTSTADIRPQAMAKAARDADLACAGPKAKPAAVAKCRKARIAAERGANDARGAERGYDDRVAREGVRRAACQAGDPDACYGPY